jgi:hypothetical protein
MTVRAGTIRARRPARRFAAVAAGVLVLGAVWSGVAAAAPTDPSAPPAAPSTECQELRAQLATAQQALDDALGALTGTDDAQAAVDSLTAKVDEACATAPALSGTGATNPAAGLVPGGTAAAAPGDLDCPDFTSQPQAQAYFESIGGSAARNADRLDRNRNGIACEDYPYATAAAPGTLPAGGFGQVSAVPSGGIETGGNDTGGTAAP